MRARSFTQVATTALAVLSSHAAFAGDPSQQSIRQHIGGELLYRAGISVAALGDVNADGTEDYIVGAIYNGFEPGQAHVHSGATGDLLYTFEGLANLDLFGFSVANAGDVNADGYPDMIVGAPLWGVLNGHPDIVPGRAMVFSGASGALLLQFTGSSLEALGWSVAGIGDVNGDGFDDVAIGSVLYSAAKGKVTVYSGANGATLLTMVGKSGERLGYSVAALNDIDGDDVNDVAAGAPGKNAAYVFSGSSGAQLFKYTGGIGSWFGGSVGRAGDLNDDGVDELMVGAPVGGHVGVFDGATGAGLFAIAGQGSCGASVSGGNDANGDAVPDFIIGIPGYATASSLGRVEVRSGVDASLIGAFRGFFEPTQFASAVAALGDVTGNGLDDVLVGAPVYRLADNVAERGAAFVYDIEHSPGAGDGDTYLGNPQSFNAPLQWLYAGGGAVTLRTIDVNNDGWLDLVLVNPVTDKLKIQFGMDGGFDSPFVYSPGDGPTDVAAGDLDGDGDIDLAVALANENKVALYANNGLGAMLLKGKIPAGKKPTSIVIADFNNNGTLDLAVANRKSRDVWVYSNTVNNIPLHFRFLSITKHEVLKNPMRLCVGYVNADNKQDLVVLNAGSDKLTTLLNTSSMQFTKKHSSAPNGSTDMILADVNSDQRLDAIILRTSANRVYVRLGKGNGTFAGADSHSVDDGPRALLAADFNHDGSVDLLTANKNAGTVSVLYSVAGGLYSTAQHFQTDGYPFCLAGCDFDDDGDLDIVTLDKAAGAVQVLENFFY